MRQPWLLMVSFLVFLTAPVAAQPNGGSDVPGLPGPLLRFLELTEEQRGALKTLQAELRDTVRPLAESKREVGAQLAEAVGSDAPDPLTVGELVLANRALDREIGAARRTFQESFLELLTDAQRLRYQAFQAALHVLQGQRRGDRSR